ncbi:hypothetical protein [Thermococcus thermotolerans]|uniref:hypothetical protein n=1 Tax=Thermococcus thermotolerans TaxID=2969672 RepID=UPI0021576084|nr:hypothetical protein [Thermococcus thermotolerans]
MRKTPRILVLLLLIALVIISGCLGSTPSPTGTAPSASGSPTSNSGETYSMESSSTETGSETGTETVTETVTQTETQTETPTETPAPNESLQYDEDGNVICTDDADPDLGCEAGETNDNGTGPGFSLPDTLINVTLEPVIIPVYRLTANFTYAGPIGSNAFEPNGEVIKRVSIITQSTEPGKNVGFMITFENESLANAYVHPDSFRDFFSGKVYTYEPTVITFTEGGEFGRLWELHLYRFGFQLYEVTGEGLVSIQNGSVEVDGADVRFTIENFSSIFPERVFMRIRLDCGSATCEERFPRRTYPSVGSFVIEAMRGWIDYYTEGSYGSPDDPGVSLHVVAGGEDLTFQLIFKDENEYRRAMGMSLNIDAGDSGQIDWAGWITPEKFTLYDMNGNVYRESNVTVTKTSTGEVTVEFTVENIFSLIPWREFRFWFSGNGGYRFPAKNNLWLNATKGLTITEDVDRYLVVLVEDVYIRENEDSREGEIQLVSWAFPVYWEHENDWNWTYGPIYAVSYPGKRWIEANDNSRLLYHEDRAISVEWSYINGYPLLAMPLDEAREYKKIYIHTAGWDVDDPGEYLTLGTGFLVDLALGLATGEIGTAMKYGYSGAMLINQLFTGESASDFWGSRLMEAFGAKPDPIGYNAFTIDPHDDYRNGKLIEVWDFSRKNIRVTYLVYEVDVPRTLRYDTLKAYLDRVSFTKDTELLDDEYYLYARAFTHFEPVEMADVPDSTAERTTGMVPVEVSYRYPPGKRVIDGNKVTVEPELLLIEHARADVPFLYLEYNAWEEDAGKWGNDDDPMGQVAITVLLDNNALKWDTVSAIPRMEWEYDFPVCGVSGGCSKAWLWVRVKPEE